MEHRSVARSREQIMKEWDDAAAHIMRGAHIVDGLRVWLDEIMGEQDYIIADLVREISRLRCHEDALRARDRWLEEAKAAAGFSRNTSFDEVWAECLAAYKARKQD